MTGPWLAAVKVVAGHIPVQCTNRKFDSHPCGLLAVSNRGGAPQDSPTTQQYTTNRFRHNVGIPSRKPTCDEPPGTCDQVARDDAERQEKGGHACNTPHLSPELQEVWMNGGASRMNGAQTLAAPCDGLNGPPPR